LHFFRDVDDETIPAVVEAFGWTNGHIQAALDKAVQFVQDKDLPTSFESAQLVQAEGNTAFVQVIGRIPRAQDACLTAYEAGLEAADCELFGHSPWFQSLPSSSNSRAVAQVLTAVTQQFLAQGACAAYESRLQAGGAFNEGWCHCDRDTRICNYMNAYQAEAECHFTLGGSCASADTHDYNLLLMVSRGVAYSASDVRSVVMQHACAQAQCEVSDGGVVVGDISPGSVNVWLRVNAAKAPAVSVIQSSIDEGLTRLHISLALEVARATEAGFFAPQDPDTDDAGNDDVDDVVVFTIPPGGFNFDETTARETVESSASASSSDDSSNAGVIAGAGAVCAVIVIIVIVRQRMSGGGAAQKNDRNVVAFENPMYDDPKSGKGASDGLYDEPKFKKKKGSKKSNPMYDSSENLAEAEGGYLDVDPDDDDE